MVNGGAGLRRGPGGGANRALAWAAAVLTLAGAALLGFGAGTWQYGTESPLYLAIVAYFAVVLAGTAWTGVHALRGKHLGLAVLGAGQLYWFALPALQVLQRDEWFGEAGGFTVPASGVWAAVGNLSLFLALSAGTYWWVVSKFKPSLFARAQGGSPGDSPLRGGASAVVLLVLGLLPYLLAGGGLSSVVEAIRGSRAVSKPWGAVAFTGNPLVVVGRGAMAAAGAMALHALLSLKGRHRLAPLAAFIVAFGITYLDTGTRTWNALILGPGLLLALRRAVASGRARRWLVLAPIAAALLVWLGHLQKLFRDQGFDSGIVKESTVALADNDFFSETALAASIVPSKFDYVGDSTVVLFLTNPIPRAMWEGKPYSRVTQVYGIGRKGFDEYLSTGLSSMPSMVGQSHMSWGLLGVFEISLFYGLVFGLIELVWRRAKLGGWLDLTAAAVAMWLFVSFRGLYPGFHYAALITAVLGLVRTRMAWKRWAAARGEPARALMRASR